MLIGRLIDAMVLRTGYVNSQHIYLLFLLLLLLVLFLLLQRKVSPCLCVYIQKSCYYLLTSIKHDCYSAEVTFSWRWDNCKYKQKSLIFWLRLCSFRGCDTTLSNMGGIFQFSRGGSLNILYYY